MQEQTRSSRHTNILTKYAKKDLPQSSNLLKFAETEQNHIFKTVLISQTITNFILAPLNRLKIMKQTCLESFLQTKKNKKILKYSYFINEIKNKQGYIGFFKGVSLTCLLSYSRNFINNFLRNKIFMELLKEKRKKTKEIYISYFGLIFTTSLLNRLITYPIDRLRTLVITETEKFFKKENFTNTAYFTKILRKEHFNNILRGINFSLFSALPESFFIFSSFCFFKCFLNLGFLPSIFFGSFFSSFTMYPFDTILKRYQSDSLLKGVKYSYKNINDLVFFIFKNEGIVGFYRGFGLGLGNNFFSVAIFLFFFNQIYYKDICIL